MKIGLASHCVIDTIVIEGKTFEQIGGPACYASLTAKNLKAETELFTKFGPDFPYQEVFLNNKINFKNGISDKPTTRFQIEIDGADRKMILQNVCEPIEYEKSNCDGFIISPVFGEVLPEVFEKIKKDSNFILVDPQGFLRRTDSKKNIFLEKTNLNLSKISALKLGTDEARSIAGSSDIEALKKVQEQGVKFILLTDRQNISLLVKDKLYSLTLPNKEIYDTTGIGDIFCSTFCCTMLKEKDFLWAFCFAGGAAQEALDTKGIGLAKVPKKGAIETNASYFYNMVKFRQV